MNRRETPFLRRVESVVTVRIFSEDVAVGACKIEPDVFGTVPVYLLTTDLPENPPHLRRLTDQLYQSDSRTRIAQEMILGVGGLRMLRAEREAVDILHINEGHGLCALFERLAETGQDLDALRREAVFTTHTPIAAGNETHPASLLGEAGYFVETPYEQALALGANPFRSRRQRCACVDWPMPSRKRMGASPMPCGARFRVAAPSSPLPTPLIWNTGKMRASPARGPPASFWPPNGK